MISRVMRLVPPPVRPYVLGAVAALLLGVVAAAYSTGRSHQRARDQAEMREQGLAAENAIAALEQNRVLMVGEYRAVLQRAAQAELEHDQADREIRLERKVSTALLVQLDSISARPVSVVVEDTLGVRRASFHAEESIASVDVDVEMPPPPATAEADISIVFAPVELEVSARCGERSAETGVRPALVSVVARPQIPTTIGRSQFDPDVCNPAAREITLGEKVRIAAPAAGVGVLVGAVVVLILTH